MAPDACPKALPPWQGDPACCWRPGGGLGSPGEGSGLSAGLTVSQRPPLCAEQGLTASLSHCSPVWGGGSDTFGTVCVSSSQRLERGVPPSRPAAGLSLPEPSSADGVLRCAAGLLVDARFNLPAT